jgi:hypothetical protein
MTRPRPAEIGQKAGSIEDRELLKRYLFEEHEATGKLKLLHVTAHRLGQNPRAFQARVFENEATPDRPDVV